MLREQHVAEVSMALGHPEAEQGGTCGEKGWCNAHVHFLECGKV